MVSSSEPCAAGEGARSSAGDAADHLPGWRVIGDTVRGATHVRNGKPNQDCWSFLAGSRSGSTRGRNVLLAVADGHGSAASFRSAKGAELAVTVALQVLWPNRRQTYRDLREPEAHRLAALIVRNWREAVTIDAEQHPFETDERPLLKSTDSGDPTGMLRAYGSTLLATLVAADSIFYLQLGDGNILSVDDQGTVESPLGEDNSLLGVETTSLCQSHAVDNVRLGVAAVRDNWPAMLLLTTDGLPTSYQDDDGCHKFARDLLAAVQTRGRKYVQQHLSAVLRNVSDQGSGDDVSVAVAVRQTALQQRSSGGREAGEVRETQGEPEARQAAIGAQEWQA